MENPKVLERKWSKPSQISKHLNCSICEDIFTNPRRLKCSHTFCEKCILTWFNSQKTCPQCRTPFKLKELGKDLIAEKIINDLEVFCINDKYCKWKDKLELLPRHVEVCEFQDKNLKEWLQTFEKHLENDPKNNKNSFLIYENEHLQERINNEVPKAPLLARLYTKDNSSKALFTDTLAFNNNEKKDSADTTDHLEFLEGFLNDKDEENEKDQEEKREMGSIENVSNQFNQTTIISFENMVEKNENLLDKDKNDENQLPANSEENKAMIFMEDAKDSSNLTKKRKVKEPALIQKLKQIKS